ncbi:MAG: RNA polymerase factor sigma-32 [Bdellovibrionota bacterium]
MAKKPPSTPRKPKIHTPEVLPAEDSDTESLTKGDEDLEDQEPTEDEISSTLPSAPLSPIIEESVARALSATDPLRRYLEEVRRYPLLSAEEEIELAMKLHRDGDLAAAKTLVSANLRLVVKIAMEYKTYYTNLLDLIQEGNIGLMKAVSKFDPTKGARLGYYASWWIRSYILKYMLDNFRLVKIGTTQAQKKLFYHLMREKDRLEAQGIIAGPKLLADKLHVREKDVLEMEQRLSGKGAELSFDTPIDSSDDNSPTHGEFMVSQDLGAETQMVWNELIALLKKRLPEFKKKLNEKELKILQDRLLNDEPKTLQEVADQYGLTRERARQIEAKVISKLKEFLGPIG